MINRFFILILPAFFMGFGPLLAQNDLLMKASFEIYQENYPAALDLLLAEKAHLDELPLYHELLGTAAFETNDLDLSESAWTERAEMNNPDQAWYQLARISTLKNDPDKCFHFLNLYMRSENPISYRQIQADHAFERISQDRRWIRFWSGDWYSEKDDLTEEALNELDKDFPSERVFTLLADKWPDDPEVMMLMARYLEKSGNSRKAEQYYRLALSADEVSDVIRVFAIQFFVQQKKYDDALILIESSIDKNPYQPLLWMERIRILQEDGAMDKAMSEMQRLVEFGIESPDVWTSLARLVMSTEPQKALDLVSRTIESNRIDVQAINLRAGIYIQLKRTDEAIVDFNQSLDIQPVQPEVYFQRAELRLLNGDTEGACHDWRKALQYGHRYALDMLSKYCGY